MSFFSFFHILVVPLAHAHQWEPLTVHADRVADNAERVRRALEVDGVLIIEHVRQLVELSTQAFQSLTKCNALTAASTNINGVFEEMVVQRHFNEDDTQHASCDNTASLEFRKLLHHTGVDVAHALDEKALAFVNGGHHKEQFHRYISSKSALPIHTDAGFFLAMTSRWEDPTIVNEIEIETPDGDLARVTIPPHAVLILGGEGFGISQDVLGVKVRAVPHAPVVKDLNSSRFWYGEMFLPDDDFPIALNLKMKDWLDSERPQDVGCLPSNHPHGSVLRNLRATCNDENKMFCWMTCIDTREHVCKNLTDPLGGLCTEEAGSHRNRQCKVQPNPNFTQPPDEPFCLPGSGTGMFMDGFQAVFGGGRSQECLVFFFKGASLDEAWKFVLALFAIIGLGVLAEGLLKLRRNLVKRESGRAMKLLLYVCNVTLGYVVMLATMTYSYEYFIAAILGLAIGHFFFNIDDKAAPLGLTACCRVEVDNGDGGDDDSKICPGYPLRCSQEDDGKRRPIVDEPSPSRGNHAVLEMTTSDRLTSPSAQEGKLHHDCHRACQGMV